MESLMKRMVLLTCVLAFALVPRVFATTECVGTEEYCGRMKLLTSPYTMIDAPLNTIVDFCTGPGPTAPCPMTMVSSPTTDSLGTETDWYNWGTSTGWCGAAETWYVRPRRTPDDWGQFGTNVAVFYTLDGCNNGLPNIKIPPAPHKPSATYPAPGESVPYATWTLRWLKATDAIRENPAWPVNYQVRLKSWPTGTTEPAGTGSLLYSGACIAYSATECKLPSQISNLAAANYRLYIDVSMDVTAGNENPLIGPIIYTNSANRLFYVQSGRPPGCCR
jgi:hypothetical protein